MDPGRIFQIITNSTLLATRLVSGPGASSLEFSESRYCAALPEDTPQAATVLTVAAMHAKGAEVRYSITGGNRDGLFTIDQHTGTITLAAALDFEINNKHDLVVAAEGGGETSHVKVRVRVSDVNDNPPYFVEPLPEVVVVEEDDRHLPHTIATVSAQDSDWLDHHGLLYTVRGDGVDGLDPSDAFFTVNSLTGDLIQLRPLDRDPPRGKAVWRVRVQVRDGQALWSRQAMHRHLASQPKKGGKGTIQGSGRRGKREARPEASTPLSQLRKIRKGTLDGGRRTGKKEARLEPTAPFSQAVSESIKGGAGKLGRSSGFREAGSDPTAYIFHPRGKSKRKGSLSRVKREEGSNSKASRSSSASSGTRLRTENHSRRNKRTSPKHQLPHKRLQRDATFEVTTETRLDTETQHSHYYLQSPSQSNFLDHLQPQDSSLSQLQYHLSLSQHRYLPPSQSLFQSLTPAATHSQVESRSSNGVDARGRVAVGRARNSLAGGRNVVQTRGKKESGEKNGSRPGPNLDPERDFGSGGYSLDPLPLTATEERMWVRHERAADNPYENKAHSANATKHADQSSSADEAEGTKDTTLEANTQTGSGVVISGEKCEGGQHLRASHPQETAEAQRRRRSTLINSHPEPWRRTKSQAGEEKDEEDEAGRGRESEENKEVAENTLDQHTSTLPPHTHTITKLHPFGENLYLHHNMSTPLIKQAQRRTRTRDSVETLRDTETRTRTRTGTRPLVHSASHHRLHHHHHNHHHRLMTELIGPITSSSSSSSSSSTPPPPSSLSPGAESALNQSAISNQMLHAWNSRDSGQEHAKSLVRRSVEGVELQSTDRRNSGDEESLRKLQEKDEEEEEDIEDEDNEEYDEEREAEEWVKACGDEGEADGEGPAGRRLGGGSLHSLGSSRVHVAETVVTLRLQDVNDNPPVFPNATMYGQVQENGPIDLSVAVVAAWDADDTSEGTNARVTYSIQKNVMHERTGEPIFSLHPVTGLVRTAVCCLDRETTPEYQIQVVATDGGGLQGTGQVVVRLVDVNDNSPRLEQRLWEVELDETWGAGPPDDASLLEISVVDPDTSNYFFYRVVESSGWGWQHFGLRSEGATGHLHAIQTLDYEDETHRRGFKFMVQVTDRGRGGWRDPRHLDSAWISVRLRDVNDNPPLFHRSHAHVTVREDAPPGTLLAALPARDPDMGGKQEVEYRVEGGWGALTVDAGGGVTLRDALDREGPGGTIGVAKVLGVDRGQPPLTATATLTITLTDINDTPPFLLPPTVFHVTEGDAPTRLGTLTATDQDVWALGHGPPFTLSLAPTNPAHVHAHINLKFDPHLDSGRGGAELWTAAAVDREQHPELLVAVRVADAGGLAATHTVTVVIDDINDNPMKPAAKTVYLWKTQGGGGSEAPLGRVFVEDPDDWDLGDKTFRWLGQPHPFFTLNTHTGDLLASSQVREGRYDLHFAVSDQLWGQVGVAANVTVAVRLLDPDALAHAAHVTLTPTTPESLAKGWTPHRGGGRLGRVVEGVSQVVGGAVRDVEVVSVQGHTRPPAGDAAVGPRQEREVPAASVWVSVRDGRGHRMDPVKLQGLLALHARQLEAATNLTVLTETLPEGEGGGGEGLRRAGLGGLQQPSYRLDQDDHPVPLPNSHPDPSSAASTTLPLQVVDTNVTSLVTPRLTRAVECHAHEPQTCTPSSCLNGGRCVGPDTEKRCVCPGDAWGRSCKVLGRSFFGDGWAWVRPLPPCLPLTLSLRLLTRRPHALVLYIGPLAPLPRGPHDPPTPMLAVQLWRGRPQLLVEGGSEPVKLELPTKVNDGDWHDLHVRLTPQGAAATVDLCGRGWTNTTLDDVHCAARASWSSARHLRDWISLWPLQVGGLAHLAPSHVHHGWREAPSPRPLDGCVSHLAFNGQLVDLGEPAYSKGSHKGCRPQEDACPDTCGYRGHCMGGFRHPRCECDPGWTGPACDTPTTPATMGPSSYAKLALSATPDPYVVTAQLRLRTRTVLSGPLLHLAAASPPAAFTLHLRAGVACVTVSGAGWAASTVCVEGYPLGDGAWHTVGAERHGHSLVVTVDDGDGWRRNESLVSLEAMDGVAGPPPALEVDAGQGAAVGVWQEAAADTTQADLQDDLHKLCVDDVRVSGQPLPLPPALNTTSWGQVSSWRGLEAGCVAQDACLNHTCSTPLSCVSTMGVAACRCGHGRRLAGGACEDLDECLWRPCLHGGTCYNLRPGFLCVCGPGNAGEHCQWTDPEAVGHHLAAPLALAFLTLSLLLLVVVGVGVSLRLRRCRLWRGSGASSQHSSEGGDGETVLEEVKGKAGCKDGEGDWEGGGQVFLECLKVQVPLTPSSPQPAGAATTSKGSPAADRLTPCSHAPAGGEKGRGGDLLLLPAQDDLRAYAYEGDGSSAGSLSSALSGLREEQPDEADRSIAPGFLEVMDLLRNLPEAIRSPLLLSKIPTQATITNSANQRGCKTLREEGKQEQRQDKRQEHKKQEKLEVRGAVYTIAGRTVVGVSGVPKDQGQLAGATPLCCTEEQKTAC